MDPVHIEVVFDPPWDPDTMATDEALDALGLSGRGAGQAVPPQIRMCFHDPPRNFQVITEARATM